MSDVEITQDEDVFADNLDGFEVSEDDFDSIFHVIDDEELHEEDEYIEDDEDMWYEDGEGLWDDPEDYYEDDDEDYD
jgi:hypothetical protein